MSWTTIVSLEPTMTDTTTHELERLEEPGGIGKGPPHDEVSQTMTPG